MIRIFRSITLMGLAVLVLALGGCDLGDMNEDPNNPTEATTPNLLSGALHSEQLPERAGIAANYWGEFTLGRFANLYAQYWTQNQYTDEDRFGFPSRRASVVNDMWEDYYFVLNDLQEIKRVNREDPVATSAYGPNENQIAIAHILQAWTAQVMTDIWGPIPFAEALQGRDGTFSPAYTPQQEIYTALLDSLTAASEMIDTGAPTMASGDIVYGGDMEQWQRFANSLKLRVAIRMADVMPERAETAVNEALAAGVFESNADNALVPFNVSPPYQNPIYENYYVEGRDDWAITETLLGVMNANEDPRRAAYATATDEGEYIGYPYGLNTGEAQARFRAGPFSRPSERVREADAPAILMLYDEVLFAQAEAAQRGWTPGDPAALYESAIRASMAYWDVTDEAAIDSYIANVPYDAGNWQEVLGTQKWLALYMQGVQGWSEWRRLDFGVLQPPAGDLLGEVGPEGIALRLTYPSDEANLNESNLNQAVSEMLGGDGASSDNQGVRLWWDVQ